MKASYVFRLVIVCMLVNVCVYAQTGIDSLQALLKQKNVVDTVRVDVLNKLAWHLKHKTPEESLKYANEALALSQQINYLKGEGEAYQYIGISYSIMGEYARATQNFMHAIAIWDKTGAVLLKANTVNNIGNVYQLQGELMKATSYFMKALEMRKALNDTASIYASYTSIAMVYKERHQFDTALYYFNEFLKLAKHQQDERKISAACNNIGMVLRNKEEYDSALYYFETALTIKQKIHDEQGTALSYRNIGDVHQLQGKHDLALKYYKQSLDIRERIGYNFGLTILLKDMAYLFLERGDLDQARVYAQRSMDVARQNKMKPEEAEALKVLSAVWEAGKNYQSALETYRMHIALKDSLFNLDKSKQIEELQAKYQSEQKEKELVVKNKAIEMFQLTKLHDERIKIGLAIVSILLVGLVILLFNRYQIKKKAEIETTQKNKEIARKNREIEEMNEELEKRMLRAQMDPHFIFNSLNSIQHFITINDKRSTLKYLSKFSRLIRRVLESSVNTVVTLEDEIELLQNYVELEALRLNDKFKYKFAIDPALDPNYIEVPFLLLQPYVENAIQHGLRMKEGEGFLHVRFIDDETYIRCEIEDNGIGRAASSASRKESHRSYGMSVTRKRLERLNNNHVTNCMVVIEDLYDAFSCAAGTKVTLTIPKQYDQSNFTFADTSHHYSG